MNKTTVTKNWKYGIPRLDPKLFPLVKGIQKKGLAYYRALVEAENDRRAVQRTTAEKIEPEIEKLHEVTLEKQKVMEAAWDALGKLTRAEREDSPEKEAHATAQREYYRAYDTEMRKVWAVCDEHFKAPQKELEALIKEAREELMAQRRAEARELWMQEHPGQEAPKDSELEVKKVGPHPNKRIKEEAFKKVTSKPEYKDWVPLVEAELKYKEIESSLRDVTPACIYLWVDKALAAKKKAALKNGNISGPLKRPRSWVDLNFGPQLTQETGKKALVIGGGSTRLRLTVHEDSKRGISRSHYERGSRHATLEVNLGQVEGRGSPSTKVTVNFVYHRPLPEDAVIKWAALVPKKVGDDDLVWKLMLTIEFTPERNPNDTERAIALNPGWRRLDNGDILVATFYDGKERTNVTLPAEMWRKRNFARSVLSASDKLFDRVRDYTQQHIDEVKELLGEETSDELRLHSIDRWRAHWKLKNLARKLRHVILKDDAPPLWRKWRIHRGVTKPKDMSWSEYSRTNTNVASDLFPEELAVLELWCLRQGLTEPMQVLAMILLVWWEKERHLIKMARCIERRYTNRRKDIFRNVAHRLRKDYRYVVLDKTNGSRVAKKPPREKDTRTKQEENANAIRQFCGISVLKDALLNKFGEKGMVFVKRDDLPDTHFGCGGSPKTSRAANRLVVCDTCGETYDQDLNRGKALLGYHYGETPDPVETSEAAE